MYKGQVLELGGKGLGGYLLVPDLLRAVAVME